MKQIVIIHGGTSFSSYEAYRKDLDNKVLNYDKLTHPRRWKERLADHLPDFELVYASMPNSANAVYEEWCVYFDKLQSFFGDDVQLVGHSLGAMFLTKYLHEKPLAKPVRQLLLVAGGYNDQSVEDLGSFAVVSAKGVEKSAHVIHLFHSQDDPVVPFTELAKLEADLPMATVHTFSDRGHFIGEEFPELVDILKQK